MFYESKKLTVLISVLYIVVPIVFETYRLGLT